MGEIDYSKVAKRTLLKNAIGEAIYEVNTRKVKFKIVYFEGKIPYGYCKSRGWWGYLHPTFIATDRGDFISATLISMEKW